MLNRYPLWKYLLVLLVALVGALYALPNVYGEDPSVQISALRSGKVDQALETRVQEALRQANLTPVAVELEEGRLLVRFRDTEVQLKAQEAVSYTHLTLPTTILV